MKRPAHILIIDDDKVNRMTLRRMLVADGYGVSEAEDGPQGLRLARESEPDLILLDVMMPGMDGFMVCQALRADDDLAEVPIVLLTSLGDKSSRLKGLDAGADDFVSKPFAVEELRARVQTITRLNRYRRLRTERARFGWVVEQAEDGYLLVSHRGELRYANGRARQLFGWSAFESPGDVMKAFLEHYTPHPQEAWSSFPRLPDGQPLYLWRAESEHSGPVWLEVKVLEQSTGSLTEVLFRLRDVTGQRTSQRSVWSFESVIAHKVRTPLTKANLGLTILRKKASKLAPEQVVEFAEQAHAGVEELKLELEKVLKYVYSPRAVPLGSGFRLAELEPLYREVCQGIGIEHAGFELQPGLPQALHIDSRAFELVLWEVVENCKKFHPRQAPRIDLAVRIDQGKVALELRDDGRRLTPHELENAFHPYYQGEKSFTGQVPGMGLGLSKLRALMWEVGGDCTLANRGDAEGVVLTLRLRPS